MSSHDTAPHRTGLYTPEYAVLGYLRLHPEVAKTYGIETCKPGCTGCQGRKTCAGVNGKTTIGWMLCQTLKAQGANIKWYDQMPNGVSTDKPKTNEEAAGWIKSFTRRPGARKKQLSERPEVAPPDHSAIQRHHGRLPRVAFPLLLKLFKQRHRRQFTSCGNRTTPLADTALVERRRLVDWVEKQLCCQHCKMRLRLSKSTSHQIGACAKLHFVCEKGCHQLKPFESSAMMHGDDYELNSRLHHAVVTCALQWTRVVPALRLLGLGNLSDTDHYGFKGEFEPVVCHMAERSMAQKHEANCEKRRTEFFTLDGGYTGPRNAHGCTMAAHGPDGAIFDVVHRRLTEREFTFCEFSKREFTFLSHKYCK
jgi:hypothetical protein